MKNLGCSCCRDRPSYIIVLSALRESYPPVDDSLRLPSAVLGALVTLWLFGNELNIYSFVCLGCWWPRENNAIMQSTFASKPSANTANRQAEAIYEGCVIRFRPDKQKNNKKKHKKNETQKKKKQTKQHKKNKKVKQTPKQHKNNKLK